jgi:hypothetical protein
LEEKASIVEIKPMCPSVTLVSTLGNPRWNADAYLAESFASKVSDAVSGAIEKQINGLILAKDLWQLDGHLRKFLEAVYTDAEQRATSGEKPTPASEDNLRSALKALRRACESIGETYKRAKAAGLTNRRLAGTALNSVRVRSGEILDIVESVELSLNHSEAVDAIFDKALQDLEQGNTVDFAQLK